MSGRFQLEDDFRELNLELGASLEEVRSSYRELALFWHPDRFHDQPHRLAKAHQRMTRINLAYERVRRFLSRKNPPKPKPSANRNTSKQPPRSPEPPAETLINTLGMKFVSVPGIPVLVSVWETRVQDYAVYAGQNPGIDPSWTNPGFAQTPFHPVVNVSWDDAKKFCAWLTAKERLEGKLTADAQYRLPTDEEWSWAVGIGAREAAGPPRTKHMKLNEEYPWGTEWPPPKDAGNYDPSAGADSFPHTSPVGSFAPNSHGLFDLGGNVWEWCEDFLDGISGVRVLRGASWNFSGPAHLLSSYRNGVPPDARSTGIGFRCVLARQARQAHATG